MTFLKLFCTPQAYTIGQDGQLLRKTSTTTTVTATEYTTSDDTNTSPEKTSDSPVERPPSDAAVPSEMDVEPMSNPVSALGSVIDSEALSKHDQDRPPPYQSAPLQRNFSPPDNPPCAPAYSQISSVSISPTSKLVSIAGQVGYDAVAHYTPERFEGQVELALHNVDKCLDAAGATRADIVQTRQYIVKLHKRSQAEMDGRARAFLRWAGGNLPPSTMVGVESLLSADLLYEIEVTAMVHGENLSSA